MAEARYAVVVDGRVFTVCLWDREAEPNWEAPFGGSAVECDDAVAVDWTYDGSVFSPPVPEPPPVPDTISDRQFFQQLAIVGMITDAEALAAVKTGSVPAALSGFLAALPADQKFNAEMLLSGATIFERHHPLTDAIGAAQGMTSEQVDDFFRAASAL